MHPELVALAARQGGVVTRAQVLSAGHTVGEIRSLTRPTGSWRIIRRGIYVDREVWDALDEYDARPLARDWAAHLTMRERHVMSHDSAGRAHHLSLLRPRDPLVHVTRPGVAGGRTEHGVKHHRNLGLPWAHSHASGLPVTPLARTAVDVAREHGLWRGVCAMDSALRGGADERDFARALVAMKHFPHITTSRAALALADAGAENAGESMARLLVLELGLPGEVQTQFPIALADGRVVWADLVVGRHVFEFDGRLKYLRPEQGGITDRDAGEVVWDEKERQRLVCAEGLGMSRIIWSDFWGPARERARVRLRSEADQTLERYGADRPAALDELAARLLDVRLRRLHPSSAG